MREFWMRLMSVVVIVGLILGYNSVLEARAKDEEIAKLLDLKPASLRSALHRARVALRIELAKEEQYESSTER